MCAGWNALHRGHRIGWVRREPRRVAARERRRRDAVGEDGEPDRGVGREHDRVRVREIRPPATTIAANTIDASPRGPNQPRNATVGRRAPVPSIATRPAPCGRSSGSRPRRGTIRQVRPSSAGQSSAAPKTRSVTPFSSSPSSSVSSVTSPSPAGRPKAPNVMPATNAAMKPEPPSGAATPVCERGSRDRDDLEPGPLDQAVGACRS